MPYTYRTMRSGKTQCRVKVMPYTYRTMQSDRSQCHVKVMPYTYITMRSGRSNLSQHVETLMKSRPTTRLPTDVTIQRTLNN